MASRSFPGAPPAPREGARVQTPNGVREALVSPVRWGWNNREPSPDPIQPPAPPDPFGAVTRVTIGVIKRRSR